MLGMRIALIPILVLSGCFTAEFYKDLSSGHIGCLPDEIEVTDQGELAFGRLWTATCHGRTYICSANGRDVGCAERH
jgi:hypothetical protein